MPSLYIRVAIFNMLGTLILKYALHATRHGTYDQNYGMTIMMVCMQCVH